MSLVSSLYIAYHTPISSRMLSEFRTAGVVSRGSVP